MSIVPSLKIAVLGAGNIGSAFAFRLAGQGGHKVTVIARPGSPRLSQLQRDKGIIDTQGGRADVEVLDALDEETAYDLVIVTTQAHQVGSVLPALLRSKAACIQFMFNTFEPERLLEAVGAERCALGMPFVQALILEDGRLKATVGAMGQRSLMNRQRSVDVFNAAGLPATLELEMLLWLRSHAPLCVAFESISVEGVRRGGGASWAGAMALALGVKECFALIRGLGHPIYPPGKARIAQAPAAAVAAILWVMSRNASFRELLATGVNECRQLVDVMVGAAANLEPPIRTSRIKAMKPPP